MHTNKHLLISLIQHNYMYMQSKQLFADYETLSVKTKKL
jgi:hypothetical protein